LDVLPGITGLAQVKGRSNLRFDELVRYDIYYVRNQSLILDFKILWWTILTIVTGLGAG
jgi:lipopolysaccharide/colanic/teichoic acid biosynthesis glycosyltransferase